MAAYPSYTQLIGSVPDALDDMVLDRDVNGSLHPRALFPGRLMRFVVKHILSPSDYLSLMAFYDANRLTTFTFLWEIDSQTYTCVFAGPPKCDPSDPRWYTVTVDIRQQS